MSECKFHTNWPLEFRTRDRLSRVALCGAGLDAVTSVEQIDLNPVYTGITSDSVPRSIVEPV